MILASPRQTIWFIIKRIRIGRVCGGNEEFRGFSKLWSSISVIVALHKGRIVLLRERCMVVQTCGLFLDGYKIPAEPL